MFDEFDSSDFVRNKIQESIPNIIRLYDKWIFRCPICGDSKKNKRKKRGFYYLSSNTYHCFNEECHAVGLNIVAKFFNRTISDVKSEFIDGLVKQGALQRPTRLTCEVLESMIAKETIVKPLIKPDSWIDLTPDALEYLNKRKIFKAPYLPSNFKFFVDTITDRLIIPWITNNEITYYQARAMDNREPKYLFPSNYSKSIFGLDNIDKDFKYIFEVEGVLDSIFIKNGIAIGGMNVSEYQQQFLSKYPTHTKVLFFDNQWIDPASMKMSIKIATENINQPIFIWPKDITVKDVNEFIMRYDNNIFTDIDFLLSRVYYGLKALTILKF